jgi:exodeoxyribonuclease VII large subunit
MHTYTLFELNEYIRRVLALNFPEGVWIRAEVGQLKLSRGHYFMELVQKEAGPDSGISAHAPAVLWSGTYRQLRRELGPGIDGVLREGLEVRLRVRVDFHERFGLKLLVEELDPAYTFGQLELQRRQAVQRLREEGLLDRQRALVLPAVLQRVAVISSEDAAGFQDFREQLAQNSFGYRFECRLFQSAVQGSGLDREMREALLEIGRQTASFDCLAILRGGGARLDLAGFDGLELCQAVARFPLPVLTGVGHDVDESVLDQVAHTALKTPTAVADFLLQHNLNFESEVLRLGAMIRSAADFQLKINQLEMERLEHGLGWSGREKLRAAGQTLDQIGQDLPRLAEKALQSQVQRLDLAEAVCHALHPDQVLRRGFTLTRRNGRVVTKAADILPGDLLETRWADGTVFSETTKKRHP